MIDNKKVIADNLAENIAFYRKQFNLTQLDLAEKLNYSDKSISKWERAEGVPDIFVISELSVFFGVTIDQMVKKRKIPTPIHKRQQAIALFYALIVWLVVSVTYGVLSMFKINYPLWKLFIYAIPASSLVLLVFNIVWKKVWFTYLYLTVFVWTLALALALLFTGVEFHLFFIVATPVYVFSTYVIFLTLQYEKSKNRRV